MQIYKFMNYLIASNNKNKYSEKVVSGDKIASEMTEHTCFLARLHSYEIYTCNPDNPSEGGWDIKLVESTDELIRSYPLFDCIITKNDCVATEQHLFLAANDI